MDRWEHIENAYHIARDLRGEDRSRFLDEQCRLDSGMRRTLDALLAHDDAPSSLLNQLGLELAAEWESATGRPAILTGRRVGSYEVLERLDSGGMADVYRAHDSALKRDIALKVLPARFVIDPDRIARFRREAEVLATLNHPNIAAIHGFEETGGVYALALELIDGTTLADRIAVGRIPFEDALPVARQMAEALQAAHERGVIHRDLKPANIKIRVDGTVKVLDFGLAKVLTPEGGVSPDRNVSPSLASADAVQTGVVLGTAAYMSPEQAKGQPVDKRTDVWAFGCVLYEMLTGRRAFAAADIVETLASVLRDSPDWMSFPDDVPAHIRVMIQECLQKDRRERIGDLSTALFVMKEQARAPTPVLLQSFPVSLWKPAAVGAAIALLAGVVGWSIRPAGNTPADVTRFSIGLPEDQRLQGRPSLAISPDGTHVVYAGPQRLYLRSMSELEGRPIAGTEGEPVTSPVFSPDGRSIVFWSGTDRALKRVPTSGGTAVTICQSDGPLGIAWGLDGIVFGQSQHGIMRVSPDGGVPELAISAKSNEAIYAPQVLPDGRGIIFTRASTPFLETPQLVVQPLSSRDRKTLIDGASDGRYLPTGHLVYAVGGRLFIVSFDLRRLEVTSTPVPIIEGVARTALTSTGTPTGLAQWSVSSTGSLVYIPGPVSDSAYSTNLALLDRTGRTELLKLHAAAYESPRFSPDGKQVAFAINEGKDVNLWIYDVTGTSLVRQITFGGRNRFPVWSPDGQRLAFQSDREGDLSIFSLRTDLSDTVQRLTRAEAGTSHLPESWSRQGDAISFSVMKDSRFSLWILSLRDKRAAPVAGVESDIPTASTFSPDGRWVAYQIGRRAVTDVWSATFVQPLPNNGTPHQITNRGAAPVWSADGNELFYTSGPRQWVVATVNRQPSFTVGNPIQLPTGELQVWRPDWWRQHDVSADGRRVGLIPADKSMIPGNTRLLYVVLNWFEEVKHRVPTKEAGR